MQHTHIITGLVLLTFAACTSRANSSAERQGAVSRTFPADAVTKLVLRAAGAQSATVITEASRNTIEVSGIPTGGAAGYHPSDPNWRETPAQSWGLDFVAQRYGDVLVVSTK